MMSIKFLFDDIHGSRIPIAWEPLHPSDVTQAVCRRSTSKICAATVASRTTVTLPSSTAPGKRWLWRHPRELGRVDVGAVEARTTRYLAPRQQQAHVPLHQRMHVHAQRGRREGPHAGPAGCVHEPGVQAPAHLRGIYRNLTQGDY